MRHELGVAEALILSTCNRTEVYWSGTASGADLSQWLERHHGNNLDLAASLYVHQESRAVEHTFSVASGLDSMVLGEVQILGQLKDAYRIAQESGSTGPILNKLFQAAFSAAKRVRTETRIGANAVSLASATVSLARRMFEDLSAHNALLVGAGDMNALTARHFMSAGIKRMVIANRTLSRAESLAGELKAHAVPLTDLDKELAEADIVISCTGSPEPLSPSGRSKRPSAPGAGGLFSWWTWRCHAISIPPLPSWKMFISFPSMTCSNWWTRICNSANWPRAALGCSSTKRWRVFSPSRARRTRARPFVHCANKRTGFASKPSNRRGACWRAANPPTRYRLSRQHPHQPAVACPHPGAAPGR